MNFMDFELSDHDFWPSRDVVYEHFQANFHPANGSLKTCNIGCDRSSVYRGQTF